MRRRAVGIGLLGIGALLLGAALAVQLFVVPTMVRLPLDQTGSTTVSDENASYFSQEDLEQHEGYVEGNVDVQGDPLADEADDDVAVWHAGTTVTDENGDIVTPPTELVFCLDRTSAESVPCDSARLNEEAVDVEGLTVTFPIGTERRDYDFWNSNAVDVSPAVYVGEEEVEGLAVYRFEQDIPEQVIDQREVPSAFAGGTESGNVTADVVFSNNRTFLVEPVTGSIVSATDNPVIQLQGPDGATGVTILSAALTPNDEQVKDKVAAASDSRDRINLVRGTLPVILLVLGIVLVVLGVLLLLRAGSRTPGRHESAAEREPASVSQAS